MTDPRPAGDELWYEVVHRTSYQYGEPMSSGSTIAHLLLRESPRQQVRATVLEVTPAPDERMDWTDVFGNPTTSLAIAGTHESLDLVSTSAVLLQPAPDLDVSRPVRSWEDVVEWLDTDRSPLTMTARAFRVASRLVPTSSVLRDFAAPSFVPGRDVLESLADLCHRIYTEFEFDPAFSDVTTAVGDVLDHRRGVCQDFAHLALGCLRSHRLAARYVSGYVETQPPPGEPKLVGSDASHAWVSVFVPGLAWIDIDPTNDQLPARQHVTAAWGRDYADVAPVQGVVLGPATHQVLEVAVDVTPVSPRR